MTKMLKEAVGKISSLPADDQDRVAKIILEEMAIEQKWADSFARSQNVLEKLAEEALHEHRAGKTQPLEDSFDGVKND